MYKYTTEEVYVPLSRLQKEGFNQRDLEIHMDLFPRDGYRDLFGNDEGILEDYGLKFRGVEILRFDQISSDSYFEETQIYRSGANPATVDIDKSIATNGFSLKEMLPFVLYDPTTDRYYYSDGRTRNLVMVSKGIPNFIANVLVILSKVKAKRFGLKCNTVGEPKGYTRVDDSKVYITNRVESGDLDELYGRPTTVHEMKENIRRELETTGVHIPSTQLAEFASELMEKKYNHKETRSFLNNEHALQFARDHFGCIDTNEWKYICVTPSTDKEADRTAIKHLRDMRSNGDLRQLRLVIFESAPNDRKNPELQFRDRMLKAKEVFDDRYAFLSKEFFNNQKPDTSSLVVYGAIPYVVSLDSEYPMNELIRF